MFGKIGLRPPSLSLFPLAILCPIPEVARLAVQVVIPSYKCLTVFHPYYFLASCPTSCHILPPIGSWSHHLSSLTILAVA
jgi:hypothetical protein